MLKINKKKIKPYGDRLDDGAMQLSFTLPVDACPNAKEAAKLYVERLGLKNVNICSMESMGNGFTYFVAYGYASHTIDVTKVKVPRVEIPHMDFKELSEYMGAHLDREVVVIGAATGSDAHTVGIDAIMNMKGYAHDYGLERYPLFKAYNLRSQLTNSQLLDKAVELNADAVLISQVVTQRDSHIKNLKEFRELWKADKRISKNVIVIIGGPRLDHAHALKLGFDAGFGPGTKPSFVASFIVHEFMKRHHITEKVEGEVKAKVEVKPQVGPRGERSRFKSPVHAAHKKSAHPAHKKPEHPAHKKPAHPVHKPAEKGEARPQKVGEHKGAQMRVDEKDNPQKKTRRGRRGGRRRSKKKTTSS